MRKLFLIPVLGAVATIAALSFSIKDNSLDSLKANAKEVPSSMGCTPAASSDCMSGATGNIYAGYKAF